MDVIKAIIREHPDAWRRALVIAGIAGIGNAAILGLINRGAALASEDSSLVGLRLLMLFGFCMVIFFYGKRYALIQASIVVEHMVRNRLLRVADHVRRSELEIIENLGRGELYSKLAKDTGLISQSGLIIVNAAQQSFVLLFCLLYIAYLSKAAFVATIATIGIGVVVYSRHAQRLEALMNRLSVKEAELLDVVAQMLDGFKEIRLNRRKNEAIYQRLVGVSADARDLKIDAQTGFCIDIMFSDLCFYTLLAIVVFLLPRFLPTYGAVILMITSAILFIIGPLQMVVQAAPVFERAKTALANLADLERRLEVGLSAEVPGAHAVNTDFTKFQTITLNGACFTYGLSPGTAAVKAAINGSADNGSASANGSNADAQGGFSIGPLNLTITRGETIFLVGGNGSGKTTTLKLLTGLYVPQSGVIKVDHDVVGRHNVQRYRELFSTVFTQFHLFDRLYGLEGVEEARVNEILEELQLSGKTRFENGRFTTTELSTGQRKRLALLVCLLEGKDILVFDEWAADQDPHFRKYFYEQVLRRLKAQGITIIAATHDDRYWHLADRVIRMEYGVAVDEPIAC
jgi:putative pyoverdin transport system ATP-binding/permease protein